MFHLSFSFTEPLKKSLAIIIGVLFIDQVLKFWVKTHMYLGEEHTVFGNWFIIHFTENPGMAFGMELGGNFGKIFLSLFRILVALLGGFYLFKLIRKESHPGLIICGSLILAGALGNIIDSIFYGKIFSDSMHSVSILFPAGGGYGGWLHGKVVDMLYFPLIETHFPSWFPIWGNEEFVFFRPVFNIADSSISIGVTLVFLFQKKFFPEKKEQATTVNPVEQEPMNAPITEAS